MDGHTIKLKVYNADLSSYSTGIYFLKFIDQNRSYSGKIVLAH